MTRDRDGSAEGGQTAKQAGPKATARAAQAASPDLSRIPTNKQEIARELEPCPFCGHALAVGSGPNKVGRCDTAGCWMRDRAMSVVVDDHQQVSTWNTRALSDHSTVTGEDPERCHRCGAHNPCWHAPSPLWNAVMRGGSIDGDAMFGDMVCATCFTALAEERGLASIWRLTADVVNVPLETVTPSGRVWDEKQELWIDPQSPPPTTQAIEAAANFQDRVQPWMDACFGAEISGDMVERGDRLLEEVLELLQSGGYDFGRVVPLRDYVAGRPAGEPSQEVGGVMVTLAAYCLAAGLDMHAAGETELARIWTKVEEIRAKQAAKPRHSPLPQATISAEAAAIERAAKAADLREKCCAENMELPGLHHEDRRVWEQRRNEARCLAAAIRALTPSPDPGDEIVERVARALCNAESPRVIAEQVDAPGFDDSSAEVQDYWRETARAALSAISGDR